MIFNMVGSGGGVPTMQAQRGRETMTTSRTVSITGLSFRPVVLAVNPKEGVDRYYTFLYANVGGTWFRYGDSLDSAYSDLQVTVTSSSISLVMSDTVSGTFEYDYVVMGFED